MKITVKKGLDVPMQGEPKGPPQNLPKPKLIALNLDPFGDVRFKIYVKEGDSVKIGQPLLESKNVPGQMFVSPAAGIVKEIRRGFKRRLLAIVIELSENEQHEEIQPLDFNVATQKDTLAFFMRSGLFPHIRLRPFNLLPDPKIVPRDIFVNALETRPFTPTFEMQVKGYERYFQAGLTTLSKLTTGKVHLVYGAGSNFAPFLEAENVEKHTASGPHPAGTASVHIQAIAPIRFPHDYVWTLTALDAVVIGKMVLEGRYFTDRIIAVAGNGILESKRGFFAARAGFPVHELTQNRLNADPLRLISGDPLTGIQVNDASFMGFSHTCLSVIPENTEREEFHFFRLGARKYTATGTYLSGHIKPPQEGYSFTTNQHGEERPFIDANVYDKVMPLPIPTMFLIKAILVEDYELAQQLGLLEVIPEDFALTSFICPSKIDMIDIVAEGLHRYSKEMGL